MSMADLQRRVLQLKERKVASIKEWKDPVEIMRFLMKHIKEPVPEVEPVISANTECSYAYATKILRRRFPMGEAAIAKNPELSVYYAAKVLNGRFEIAEEAISCDPYWSYLYAHHLKQRFTKGEKAIATVPYLSVYYAMDVIRGRFELGEDRLLASEEYRLVKAYCKLVSRCCKLARLG